MSNGVQNAMVVAIGAVALAYLLWRWINVIKNRNNGSCGCGCKDRCSSCHQSAYKEDESLKK